MALEAAFENLGLRVRAAYEALVDLRVTVLEDRPLRGEAALADGWGDAVEDLAGSAHEAVEAADEARRAIELPPDLDRARRSLSVCHERVGRVAQGFWSDLASFQRVGDLTRLGRRRRGEWLAWTESVRVALDRCHAPLRETDTALLRCWQEIAERVGTTSMTFHARTIGCQVVAPAPVTAPDQNEAFSESIR
jgi:hypothetical protein